jgi:hypothetical protein
MGLVEVLHEVGPTLMVVADQLQIVCMQYHNSGSFREQKLNFAVLKLFFC